MKLSAPAVLFALIAAPAIAGPFGVDFTKDTLATLRCEANTLPYSAPCKTMPDQSWNLGEYMAMYRDGLGLCSIIGKTPPLTGDASGDKLRAAADALKDQIAAEYGAPRAVDGAKKRRKVSGGQLWTQEVAEGDRDYAYSWTFDPPQDGAGRLILSANADKAGQSWIEVQAEAPYLLECFMRRD